MARRRSPSRRRSPARRRSVGRRKTRVKLKRIGFRL